MPPDGLKKGPSELGSKRAGTKKIVTHSLVSHDGYGKTKPPSNLDWWSLEFQQAVNILADPIYSGLRIQITGQAGCGYHPPTADPDELERFAREVGFDASYSIVTGNGRVSFPVPLGPPMGNGDRNTSTPQIRGRVVA